MFNDPIRDEDESYWNMTEMLKDLTDIGNNHNLLQLQITFYVGLGYNTLSRFYHNQVFVDYSSINKSQMWNISDIVLCPKDQIQSCFNISQICHSFRTMSGRWWLVGCFLHKNICFCEINRLHVLGYDRIIFELIRLAKENFL